MCNTLNELYDEMELWQWNEVQHNRWTRALKACNQVRVQPLWYVDEQENEDKKLSWATATRLLRKLKARILRVGEANGSILDTQSNPRTKPNEQVSTATGPRRGVREQRHGPLTNASAKGHCCVTEDDRATLQAWLDLVDWTGLGIAPKYPIHRRLKLNMDSMSTLHQWLTLKERQCGVHHHDAAQMFTNFRKELETLAKAIENQESDVAVGWK